MSCAYRTAATRIATIATIPPDLMLTAMDSARQRRVTFPDLPPDRLRTIAPLLGIAPTCGNPQQIMARIHAALLILGTLHSTHLSVERWMAMAVAHGVPDDHLPVSVHPEIMATVCAQWAAPPPNPAPDRTTAGIAALWQGDPIPAELIEEALRTGDRRAIVTWIAHGVWDDRFTDVCRNLTDAEIGTIVRAGVVPDALVARVAQRWWSSDLPWNVFPLTLWDRVADPEIAREGRARTAAMTLIHHPTLRDDRLIAAAAEKPWYAKDVLIVRTDFSDDRLIAAVAAQTAQWAAEVLIRRFDLSDDRLIAAVATKGTPWDARNVLVTRHDLHDDRLIAAVAKNATCARDVLITRRDLGDDRLIAAVAAATDSWYPRTVLIERTDLSDPRLIAAVAENAADARAVLVARTDLSDPRLIAAVAKGTPSDAYEVLCVRHDISDDHLIDAVATAVDATYARDVLIARPDLRTDVRLLTAIAHHRAMVDNVRTQYPDLRDHPLLGTILNQARSSP